MKKNLLMALVAVMAMAQTAHAAKGTEKDGKSDAIRAQEARAAKEGAARDATHGADAGTIGTTMKALDAERLTIRLSPNQKTDLGHNMSNPVIAAAVKGTLAQSKTANLRDLAMARLEALANVKQDPTTVTVDALAKLDSSAKLEQAYDVLAVNAGEAAKGWSPELRDNLTFLLTKANELIAQGRTKSEAMTEANTILAKSKAEGGRSVRLNLDDVNKWCNK